MTAAPGPAVRVLVFHRAPPGQPDAVPAAHRCVAADLDRTPGLRRHQLLRAVTDPAVHVLVMEWDGPEVFAAWERELRQRGHPSPLRPFQDRTRPGGHYELFTVTSAHAG